MEKQKKEKGKNDHLIEGGIMISVGVVFMLILVGVFGKVGKIITNFFVGTFGYAIYAYFLALIIIGILTICKVKRPKISWVRVVAIIMFFAMIISLLHCVSSSQYAHNGYGKYLITCYEQHNTAGGILAGVFMYPLLLVDYLGIVITSILALGFCAVFVFFDAWVKDYKFAKKGIPTNDMVDFRENVSEQEYSVVGNDLYIEEGENKKKKSAKNQDEYIPLSELQSEDSQVVFDQPVSSDENEIQTEEDEKESILKNFFASLKSNKEEKKEEQEPISDFDNAYNILYKNESLKKEDSEVEKNSKSVLENKQDYESYTNNYRMNKIKKNLGVQEDSGTTSIFDFKANETSKENKIFDDVYSEKAEDAKEDKHDYFAVDEIVFERNSNVENIKQVEDIKVDDQKPAFIEKKQLDQNVASNNFNASEKQNTTQFEDFVNIPKFEETLKENSNTNKPSFEEKNQNANTNYDNIPVVDKTANHDEINDFHDLLMQKKKQREEKEKEILQSRHIVNIDDKVIPTIEEEIKRRERSDKGGTHQMGRGVNFGLINNPSIDPNLTKEVAPEQKKEKVKIKLAPYKYPPVELLNEYDSRPPVNENFDDKIAILENTLSEFGIDAKVNNVVTGPTFTRLELSMPRGISVNKVSSYVNDIAMCLEVKSVRCQIPIPGKNAFGVEIPNAERGTVGLKSVIQSDAFHNPKQKVSFALGQDCDGNNYVADLTTMPHLLIAGATGAGKSVCLNSLIVSLLYKYTPEEVKLLLVDPKQVELNMYNKIPHLLIPEAISDKDKALNLLDWAIEEMEMRYTMFKEKRVQKITDYNACIDKKEDKLPFVVIIIDEVGDFMVTIKKELEDRIVRLTQKARAAGIHLILATQRPSVDVITGIIKANLPSRIAFAVPSFSDSKTIIDQGGAEKLLRNGDMIFVDGASPEAVRIQGTFISGAEVNAVCDYVRDHNEAYFDKDIEEFIMNTNAQGGGNPAQTTFNESSGEQDELFVRALYNVVSTGSVSISKLQRKFGIGFPRAARLVDTMEELGYIGVAKDNNKQREILIDMPTLLSKYGDVNLE